MNARHCIIARLLADYRNDRGFSQKTVARLTTIGEKTLSSIETGKRTECMKFDQLCELLAAYNVTLASFEHDLNWRKERAA